MTADGHAVSDQRWFEDFKVGDRFESPGKTLTDAHFMFFAGMTGDGLPPGPKEIPAQSADQPEAKPMARRKSRGRVNIKRQTAGRGGKTVTVISGFVGIGLPEKEKLAKQMQKVCGTGGTMKEGHIEIQGDKRTEVARILTEAGFSPVFAGG